MRRRSVSAALPSSSTLLGKSQFVSGGAGAVAASPSPQAVRRNQMKQAILDALKEVLIPGVTTDEIVQVVHTPTNPVHSTDNISTNVRSSSPSPSSALSTGTVTTVTNPVATEEVRDLTDDDHRLLSELDAQEVAPLLSFLKEIAPELYGELPARFSPEVGEEIILHLIAGDDDLTGSKQRRRGMTTARWHAVKSLTHTAMIGGSNIISSASPPAAVGSQTAGQNSDAALLRKSSSFIMNQSTASSAFNQSGTDLLSGPTSHEGDDHYNYYPTVSSSSASPPNSRFARGSVPRRSQKFVTMMESDGSPNFHANSGKNNFHSGTPESQQMTMMTAEEELARFEAEAADRERKIQAVLNGVKEVSRRHKDRTLKLRMANKDIADVAVQVIASPGAKVVTTTGRPPPSHAVDAVGGIKQQMTTTRGEPPLMVLRQELEDRQALASAMPRIRARVAELMGKLSGPRGGSGIRPSSAAAAASPFHNQRKSTPNASASPPPPTRRTKNAHVGNFFASNVADDDGDGRRGSASNKRKGGKDDQNISEIARRLRLRSDSLGAAAERQHREAVEKRRAASQLRRELVAQGVWVDVRVLSMFRPPAQVKAFVASWQEFKSVVVHAVSPLPPGCAFASLSYLSGPGSRSVIDPRHPLLRPLRGFEVVRGCKTRDGTCAALTVSVAIRSSAETAGLPQDFEV